MQQEIQILLRGQPWPVNDAPCTTADSRMKVKSPPHTRPGSLVASKILLMPTSEPERVFFLNRIKTSCLHNTHHRHFFSFIHTRSLLPVQTVGVVMLSLSYSTLQKDPVAHQPSVLLWLMISTRCSAKNNVHSLPKLLRHGVTTRTTRICQWV